MEAGIYQREIFLAYDSIIQNARNDLVRMAVKHDFDDLVYIDGDEEWRPEWLLRLLAHKVDVVGYPVRKKTDEAELYNVKYPNFDIPVDATTGLLMPESVGTGFLRLSRKALRALWDSSEPYRVLGQEEESRWIFDIRPVNGFLVGEDTLLSSKLRALGFQTYLDASITCAHIGAKKYAGNFAAWLQRAKATHPKEAPLPAGLWVMPSRKRVGMLDRFFKAAAKTGTSTRGVVLVEKNELIENAAEYAKLKVLDGWSIQATEAEGLVAKIHEAEPLYMDEQWVGIVVDDCVPETQQWDRILVAEAMKHGRIVCSNDGSEADAGRVVCGATVMPTALVRAMGGHVFPEGFKHLCVDDVLEAINAETGCVRQRLDVMVRHLHPWITGVVDDTHRETYSKQNGEHAIQVFKEWKNKTMPATVERVKKYLAEAA